MFHKSVINVIGSVLLSFITAINILILARILSPSVLGQYTYALWMINISVIIATMGIPVTLLKYIPEMTQRLGIMRARMLFMFLSGLGFLFSIIIALFIAFILPRLQHATGYLTYLYLIAGSIPLLVFINLFSSYFKSRMKFGSIYTFNAIYSVLLFFATCFAAFVTKNVTPVLWGYFIAALVYSIFLLYLVLRNIHIRLYIPTIKDIKTLLFEKKSIADMELKEVLTYIFSVSFILLLDNIIWDRSEVFFLKHFSTNEQIAYYSIAFSVVQKIMYLLPTALSGYLLTTYSLHRAKGREKEIMEILFKACKFLLIINIPLALGGAALSTPIIEYLFGHAYVGATGSLRFLFLGAIASPASLTVSTVIYGQKRQYMILYYGIICTILSIILDIILISHFSAIGAAIANSIVQLLFGSLLLFYAYRSLHIDYPYRFGASITGVSLLPAILLFFLNTEFHSIIVFILSIIAASVIYCYLILKLGIVNRKDISFIDPFIKNDKVRGMLDRFFLASI